jgi:hypothetical protein
MTRWIAEGRTLGASLRRFHAVIVAGGDLEATAQVALGIAEAQAATRHVVLGDLSGSPAFAPLIADDDPHGLVDAFDYGISLARVARPVAGFENLQFAPMGSVAPDYPEILAHPRWTKLRNAFSESDHLLIIVLPVGVVALGELLHHFDGIVLVDAMAPASVEASRVIANVVLKPLAEPKPQSPPPKVASAPPAAAPARPAAPASSSKPAPRPPAPAPASGRTTRAPSPAPTPDRQSTSAAGQARPTGVFTAFARPAGYGAGLSILAAFIIFWFLNGPFGDRDAGTPLPVPLPEALKPVEQPKPPDPNLPNPADSGAAAYAVRMLSANTQAGAILQLQEYGDSMPAATWAPVEKSGRTWYEVLAGAFITRGGADSLLTSLRSAGRLDSISPGVVVRVPYAVLIDSVRKSATVADLLMSLRMRQLPVYALDQRNGWVWIVAGAFETRSQADSYSEKIRASGQPADVVLRQGRMF